MKKYIAVLFLLLAGYASAQDSGYIEGMVLDKELNNEPLAFATVHIKETKETVISNIDGAYALEVTPGSYTLIISFPGYEKVEVKQVQVEVDKITSLEKVGLGVLEIPSTPITTASLKEKK